MAMTTSNRSLDEDEIKWKPFLTQLMIVSSVWTYYFILGLQFGTTTVLVPQLKRENITVSDDMVSWMHAGTASAAIPWNFIHSILAHTIGWKKTSALVSFATIAGTIVFFFSWTPAVFLLADFIFGVTQGATGSIYVVLISEFSSPKYRGTYLCVKSASFLWGVWVANAIGAFTQWMYIPVASFIASLYTLTVFFWPESPRWLASRNRLTECRRAHRLLKGDGEKADQELNRLIQAQIDSPSRGIYNLNNLRFVLEREFFLPLLICMLALLSYLFSGKLVITAYAVDMIKKMIKDDATVIKAMLILDGITVFCAYVGSYLAKNYSRRKIWLTTFGLAIIFLLLLSLEVYLVKLAICSENIYLSIFLLAGYSVSISCGPMVLALAWAGELIAYKYKSISIVIVSVWYQVLLSTSLKTTPLIVSTFGMHGTFLFYALTSAVCSCIMYFYLPETKNKTLDEIEEYFKDVKTVEKSNKFISST